MVRHLFFFWKCICDKRRIWALRLPCNQRKWWLHQNPFTERNFNNSAWWKYFPLLSVPLMVHCHVSCLIPFPNADASNAPTRGFASSVKPRRHSWFHVTWEEGDNGRDSCVRLEAHCIRQLEAVAVSLHALAILANYWEIPAVLIDIHQQRKTGRLRC